MPNTKISALTAASTPLAGTEVLPIVQSGTNKKVSVADLTAGRAVASAGGTFSDNFVQGTAAKGVNFTANTPAAGMTSQLLNWYEEGTWTPTAGVNLTVVGTFSSSAKYTKIGRQVSVIGTLVGSTSLTVPTGGVLCGGLPFTVSNFGLGNLAVSNAGVVGGTFAFSTIVLSQTAIGPVSEIYFSATYFV